MALIVCHSPRGGAGTSFVAAQLAMQLAADGGCVTLLDCGFAGTTALNLGLVPSSRLPAGTGQPIWVEGVRYRHDPALASCRDADAVVASLGALAPSGESTLIVDLPSGAGPLAAMLNPYAHVSLCALAAAPDCVTMVPGLLNADQSAGISRLFVVNAVEETRRIARHCETMFRAILGEQLVGRIRRDVAVDEAQAMLLLLSRYTPESAALADVAALARVVRDKLIGAAPIPLPSRRAA